MSFDTVAQILRVSEEMFEEHTRIEVDLFEVTDTDSAGLALLLEWITWANHTVREIRFRRYPGKKSTPSPKRLRSIIFCNVVNAGPDLSRRL